MSHHLAVRTDRLDLTRPERRDVEGLFELHADPRVWEHLPSGRHTERRRTRDAFDACRDGWEANGLDYWTVRRHDEDTVIGMGGCSQYTHGWNLYYRFAPESWGNGYAQELVAAARAAANKVRPDLPVVAYLLERNDSSRRTAERAGLELVWRGPEAGSPDPDAIRLVYADRRLGPGALQEFGSLDASRS
jgi:RimJ/RimL family protein N-acetyltransferase